MSIAAPIRPGRIEAILKQTSRWETTPVVDVADLDSVAGLLVVVPVPGNFGVYTDGECFFQLRPDVEFLQRRL